MTQSEREKKWGVPGDEIVKTTENGLANTVVEYKSGLKRVFWLDTEYEIEAPKEVITREDFFSANLGASKKVNELTSLVSQELKNMSVQFLTPMSNNVGALLHLLVDKGIIDEAELNEYRQKEFDKAKAERKKLLDLRAKNTAKMVAKMDLRIRMGKRWFSETDIEKAQGIIAEVEKYYKNNEIYNEDVAKWKAATGLYMDWKESVLWLRPVEGGDVSGILDYVAEILEVDLKANADIEEKIRAGVPISFDVSGEAILLPKAVGEEIKVEDSGA